MQTIIRQVFIVLLLLIVTKSVRSQQLYLSHQAYENVAEMTKAIPALAEKIVERYQHNPLPNKLAYYGNLFRYQMIAGQYEAALKSIDSAKAQYKATDSLVAITFVFPFWLYAKTGYLTSAGNPANFNLIFDSVFSSSYEKLSFKAADKAENYFKATLQDRQQRYIDQVNRLKRTGKDSISYSEAQSLCFSYLNYIVYSYELPKADSLMEIVNKTKYIIEDSVMITMRDGAKIAATVVRSRTETKPQPVILKFGIYSNPSEVPETKFIAAHGYVGVIADTRGKRLSPDSITPFEHDANDGYDIIDWISKQPWCNGKIGMYGGSYLGFSQWATVKKLHPALKTIVPIAAVGAGIDFPGMNGIYGTTEILSWLHFVTDNKYTLHNYSASHWDNVQHQWYATGTAFNSLDSIHGKYSPIFHSYTKHSAYDNFWGNMVPFKKDFSQINIPVLTISGYYDDDQRGALYYFNQHYLFNKNANHYLLLGPYDHGGVQGYPFDPSDNLNGYKIDSCAKISIMDLVFQWFDYTLKGKSKPILLKEKINFEVMGSNIWRHATTISKINNDTLTFYISDKKDDNYYKLENVKPLKLKSIIQKIDFKYRSDSLIDENLAINGGDFLIVDSVLNTSNHVIFTSNLFENDFDINGSFIANLNVITNKSDFDISIRLYEQLPNGFFFQLSNNIARCSYLNDNTRRQLLKQGKLEHINFNNTFFTSKHIQAGSRLVLLIGVNKSPYWQINYGTGKDVSKETISDATIPLKLQWLTNGSCIKIPIWK